MIAINCNLLHPAMSHVTKPAAIPAQSVLVDNDSTATKINMCMGLPKNSEDAVIQQLDANEPVNNYPCRHSGGLPFLRPGA